MAEVTPTARAASPACPRVGDRGLLNLFERGDLGVKRRAAQYLLEMGSAVWIDGEESRIHFWQAGRHAL